MSDASSNLALPFLRSGQAQKHVTINESLLRLDALVQLGVVSASVSTQPASPADGDRYILPSGKTGAAWAAMSTYAIAYYRDGVWEQLTPKEGWIAFVRDTDELRYFSGSVWAPLTASTLFEGAVGASLLTWSNTTSAHDMDARFQAVGAQFTLTPKPGGTADTAKDFGFDFSANEWFSETSFRAGSVIVNSNLSGYAALTRTMAGVELCAVAMSTTNKLTPAIKFMSSDVDLTTENPKLLAAIAGRAAQAYSADTSGGMGIDFFTTPNSAGASSVPTLVAYLSQTGGFVVGSPTGGDKGAGTINASAVYDDNTLLTCAPIEFLRDGAIDTQKWDELASLDDPNAPRRNEAVHVFKRMVDEGFDPRDPANFCARMKADGAAPGLMTETEWRTLASAGEKPDMGAMLTRTFLAVDNLAVAFVGVVERLEQLERASAGES